MKTDAKVDHLARGWAGRAGAATAIVLVAAAMMLVLGVLFPTLPYAGVIGTSLANTVPGYIGFALIAGSILAWCSTAGKLQRTILGMAALGLIGLAMPTWSLVRLAQENGVRLTAFELFGTPNTLGSVPPDEIVTYTHDLGEALTARIFRPMGTPPRGGWPVLVYIHGGGWTTGTNAARSTDWRWFATHGWMVVSVGYSLSSERRHLWDRVTGQLGCALAWTNANIGKRQGNAKRLALVGDSAGGNLVLNLGYLASAGRAPSVCGGHLPPIEAVISDYPGVDLAAVYSVDYPWIKNQVRGMVTGYIGGTPQQFSQRYATVASENHVHRGAPPTLLFITESDHLVPVPSMRAFDARARSAGIKVRTINVPYGAHGFDTAGIGKSVFRQISLQFLNQH